MILAVSAPDDQHAGAVVDLLRDSGREVAHLDVPSLSADTGVELETGRDGVFRRRLHLASRPGRPIDLDSATTGFWRRRHAPVLSRDLAVLAEVDGSPMESTESFESVIASLDLDWVNDPVRDHIGRRRPRQWAAASAAGLALPATRVTRDPEAAIAFRDEHLRSGVVTKPLTRLADDWGGCAPVISEDDLVERVLRAPAETVLQELLPGPDLRVIVVGGASFAVEFGEDSTGLPRDLSADDESVRPTELPACVLDAIGSTLRRLGLVSAAVDLRRGPDGVHRFLDLDPAPRWLLLEELTGWPITQAVVDALTVREDALLAQRAR